LTITDWSPRRIRGPKVEIPGDLRRLTGAIPVEAVALTTHQAHPDPTAAAKAKSQTETIRLPSR
jgi:hypothetical protein